MSNNSPADSLRALAYMLTPGMEYPGTIEIETLPILRDYYTYCGNSDKCTPTSPKTYAGHAQHSPKATYACAPS